MANCWPCERGLLEAWITLTTPSANFADLLIAEIERKQSCVVVGLDPRPDAIPAAVCARYVEAESGRAAAAMAIAAFNSRIIEIVAPHVCAVKPQIAFYEQFGWEGVRAYAWTVDRAHEAGLLVIGDVKRGDIGSTAQAYAEAHFEAFDADAVTLNPYLGTDSIQPFLDMAELHAKGAFVLVKTSNPSSSELQDLDAGGRPLYMKVAELLEQWGADLVGERGYSSIGAVVGATYPEEAARLRRALPKSIFLVPGFGAQGATADDCRPCFNADGLGAIVNSSRGIIFAWERPRWRERFGESQWEKAIEAAVVQMKEELAAVSR